ncbi:MAG: ABC transporter permease [Pseudonocardia sp.]|uniref:ABC transporter permease n=1 Tax=Pseudonocardia sp. TaxID=60912 RepID=UPI001ACE389D|nr:ABC transporter permease [Pseudonocardia sp.]MBN9099233.1 ABC transporter permease [Pseudonocardia sp.]
MTSPLAPPGYGRGVLIVVEHFWTWYRRNWRATAVSSVLQPLLFLLAFGVGFGSLVDRGGGAAAATGGVSYLVYLAPALLAVSAVQSAAFESTYPVLSGFKWQRIYHAMTAGPITPGQVALGHLAWVAAKMAGSGAIYIVVIALVGGVTGPGIVVSLLAAVLTGAAVASLVTAFAATVETEGGAFNVIFRFVVIPMTLFSGTFFPVDRLPAVVRPLAWVSPLWHGTELARMAALGRWTLFPALGHLAYLSALLAVGVVLATRLFTRRLAR